MADILGGDARRREPESESSRSPVLLDERGMMRDSVELDVEEGQTGVKIDPRLRGN